MLQLLAAHEPQLTQIVTLTAEDNEHMNAINTELGFVVLERQLSWELKTARAARPAGLAAPGAGPAHPWRRSSAQSWRRSFAQS
jgi:hypothetical protein